jgi:hypothetical protein
MKLKPSLLPNLPLTRHQRILELFIRLIVNKISRNFVVDRFYFGSVANLNMLLNVSHMPSAPDGIFILILV